MYLTLLDQLMRRQPRMWPAAGPALTPVWEEDAHSLTVRFRTTGLDPRSVQVQVSEYGLSVSGHRTHEERLEGPGFFRYSAAAGAVARSFPLPCRVVPGATKLQWRSPDELEVRLIKA